MREVRLKNMLSDEAIKPMWGKLPTDNEYAFLITNDAKVYEPNGQLLAVYRRGIIPESMREASYPTLHELRKFRTNNRGMASGSLRFKRNTASSWEEARAVPSAIVGYFDPIGPRTFCRTTAWTGREFEKFSTLFPLLNFIGERMHVDAPERWAAQSRYVAETDPDWVIPGTPFSTVTVNNTYPTGCHVDKGDLDEGISTLAVLRRGSYTGGRFTLPQFGVAVDMQDGDLLLLNAHRMHGNTQIYCTGHMGSDPRPEDIHTLNGPCEQTGTERISVVCYYRTKIATCGTRQQEDQKRMAAAERDNAALVESELDENAELLAAAVSRDG
jgi:2-oxoglutarate-Fe(II)-dependent dioxygenase family protein